MLPEREKQICARLRQFRELRQIPRTKFALSIGIGGERLASYESGRARLQYETFAAIQRRYGLNPDWLALGGDKPIFQAFNDGEFASQIAPRALFSDVFALFITKHLEAQRLNEPGREANLKLFVDLGNVDVLKRLKIARLKCNMSLEHIAKMLNVGFGGSFTARQLEKVESGKSRLSLREMACWMNELKRHGINEDWIWTGKGLAFDAPGIDSPSQSAVDGPSDWRKTVSDLRAQAESLATALRVLEVRLEDQSSNDKGGTTP